MIKKMNRLEGLLAQCFPETGTSPGYLHPLWFLSRHGQARGR